MYKGDIQYIGDPNLPDIVYYNADIINNETKDQINGATIVDPQIRFNETRDKPIIRDSSQYHFSIIRFTMNGANQDLPLFIPSIQQGTGQSNVNLTSYSLALTLTQTFNVNTGSGNIPVTITVTPPSRFVQYESETQNLAYAPLPRSTANPQYQGLYNSTTLYNVGDIVGSGFNPQSGAGVGPFYQVKTPAPWIPTQAYGHGAFVLFQNKGYYGITPVTGVAPNLPGSGWTLGLLAVPPTNSTIWVGVSSTLGTPQDLSSRYYWVYTYQHWLDLINKTLYNPDEASVAPPSFYTSCLGDLFQGFYNAWVTQLRDPYGIAFPYNNLGEFAEVVQAPTVQYSPATQRFTILADSDAFGQRLLPFIPSLASTGPLSPPSCRLFMNSNTFGMFSGFSNTYWNTFSPTAGPFPGLVAPEGYVNEILFPNKMYQNVLDYRIPPSAGVAPLGYVPISQQKVYWIAEQDHTSTDSLWSPVSSIVFTSSLLPVLSEFTGQPVTLGTGNVGNTTATTQSAFQPIITDIALDTTVGGASAYRQFVYYSPVAEYRLSDFTNSRQEVRQIDIQVFWKNRLDNQLYPIQMFNLSSVSLKVMFRKK